MRVEWFENPDNVAYVAIDDFAKLGETDPMFKKLDEICKRHNSLWNAEAEKYLLANAKAI